MLAAHLNLENGIRPKSCWSQFRLPFQWGCTFATCTHFHGLLICGFSDGSCKLERGQCNAAASRRGTHQRHRGVGGKWSLERLQSRGILPRALGSQLWSTNHSRAGSLQSNLGDATRQRALCHRICQGTISFSFSLELKISMSISTQPDSLRGMNQKKQMSFAWVCLSRGPIYCSFVQYTPLLELALLQNQKQGVWSGLLSLICRILLVGWLLVVRYCLPGESDCPSSSSNPGNRSHQASACHGCVSHRYRQCHHPRPQTLGCPKPCQLQRKPAVPS